MAAKDENIRRLHELAVLLGRNADISGSAAEIQQRVMEWEEEASDPSGDAVGMHSFTANPPAAEGPLTGWVAVRVLKTLHMPALTLDGREISDAVMTGAQVQIQACHFHELEAAGLVSQ